ncbi:hypothetical protein NXV73_10950 [Bacteroides salyersiae]|nr:hypothetical protein [Bacteroides salyersiae]
MDGQSPEIIAGLIKKYPRCGVFGTSYYFCRPGKKPFLPCTTRPVRLRRDRYDS